ncbi:MAG: hypothetical protein ACYCVW_16845, partial [Rhodocyclaceae bacterium]
HKDVPLASGSVPGQCRSKTVSSRKVEQKDRIRAASNQRKTPQAIAHCGVSNRKLKPMRRTANDQNLGDSFGGV